MVKTKIVKKSAAKVKPPVEVKTTNKGDYREKGDWWNDIMSGETCRTFNFDKVIAALGRARDEKRGLNVQGFHERGTPTWYITLILTENETKPAEKGKRK